MPKLTKSILILLGLFCLFFQVHTSYAQTYSFQIPREIVNVYWNKDGTLAITYQITFSNSKSASPIDFVDIGLPTSDYDISTISASVNGNPIQSIEKSPYVKNGVALNLGQNSILPGATGIVTVIIPAVKNVLYVDSQDSNYVSAVFSPTWFGSEYVSGATDLTVVYHLPPGITPVEPRWHSSPAGFPSEPITGFDNENRITYTWSNPSASASTQYKFGASFPKKYIPESAIVAQSINLDFLPGLISALLCFGIPGIFIALIIYSIIQGQKRKLQYLPPKISIEGHGIKRGLTAVEAAILLEQPLDKILTMILFSTIKKGAVRVISKDPFDIQELQPQPENIRPYEKKFIDSFKEKQLTKRRVELQNLVIELVREVQEKMRGFSRKETIEYYRDIVQRAWKEVESANTPEIKSQKFDESLEWTMLDDDYDDHTRRVFREGPVFVPTWWSRYDPLYTPRPMSSGTPGAKPFPSPLPTTTSLPHLPGSDFAASIVNGVQNLSASTIGNLTEFTSKITNKTNPAPVTTTSRSTSRSGGCACACACACAGCACACAGGGR